jgi:hypothetical protein
VISAQAEKNCRKPDLSIGSVTASDYSFVLERQACFNAVV